MRKDPDFERSSKVSQAVAANINCYKEMYTLMKSCSTLDKFFVEKTTTTSSESD